MSYSSVAMCTAQRGTVCRIRAASGPGGVHLERGNISHRVPGVDSASRACAIGALQRVDSNWNTSAPLTPSCHRSDRTFSIERDISSLDPQSRPLLGTSVGKAQSVNGSWVKPTAHCPDLRSMALAFLAFLKPSWEPSTAFHLGHQSPQPCH